MLAKARAKAVAASEAASRAAAAAAREASKAAEKVQQSETFAQVSTAAHKYGAAAAEGAKNLKTAAYDMAAEQFEHYGLVTVEGRDRGTVLLTVSPEHAGPSTANLSRSLKERGFHVVQCNDAATAKQHLSSELVISAVVASAALPPLPAGDVNMPGPDAVTSGVGLMAWVHSSDVGNQTASEEILFVILVQPELTPTAAADGVAAAPVIEKVRATVTEAGAWGAWQLPVPLDDVESLVSELTRRQDARRRESRMEFEQQVPLRIWTGTFNIACARNPFEVAAATVESARTGPEGAAAMKTAEMAVDEAISHFVPNGYDVYILGVQEGQGDTFGAKFCSFCAVCMYSVDDERADVQLVAVEAVSDYLMRKCGATQFPCRTRIEGRGDGSFVSAKYTGIFGWAKQELVAIGAIRQLGHAHHGFNGNFSEGVSTKAVKDSLGSKGGAALALQLFDTTVLCLSCHLAKEYHTTAAKRAQYEELAASIGAKIVGTKCPSQSFQWHSQYHHVIWLGDFNYHIDDSLISPADTLAAIGHPDGSPWNRLGMYDEMQREISSGSCWYGFIEPPKACGFYPTYKKVPYRPRSDYAAGSAWVEHCYKVNFKQQWYKGGNIKLRMPSWTDRIVYRSLAGLEDRILPTHYAAVNEFLRCSDHSPVYATFNITAVNQRRGPALADDMYVKVTTLKCLVPLEDGTSREEPLKQALILFSLPWERGSLAAKAPSAVSASFFQIPNGSVQFTARTGQQQYMCARVMTQSGLCGEVALRVPTDLSPQDTTIDATHSLSGTLLNNGMPVFAADSSGACTLHVRCQVHAGSDASACGAMDDESAPFVADANVDSGAALTAEPVPDNFDF